MEWLSNNFRGSYSKNVLLVYWHSTPANVLTKALDYVSIQVVLNLCLWLVWFLQLWRRVRCKSSLLPSWQNPIYFCAELLFLISFWGSLSGDLDLTLKTTHSSVWSWGFFVISCGQRKAWITRHLLFLLFWPSIFFICFITAWEDRLLFSSARYYGALLSLNTLARSPSGDLLVQVLNSSAFPLRLLLWANFLIDNFSMESFWW